MDSRYMVYQCSIITHAQIIFLSEIKAFEISDLELDLSRPLEVKPDSAAELT